MTNQIVNNNLCDVLIHHFRPLTHHESLLKRVLSDVLLSLPDLDLHELSGQAMGDHLAGNLIKEHLGDNLS
jgi:hypothetical protein